MRKILCCLVFFVTLFMEGQEIKNECNKCEKDNISTIEVDFKCPTKINLPKTFKEGEFYRIKVTNINTNLYSVLINSKDTIISEPKMATPMFSDISLDAISKLTSKFTNNIAVVNSVDSSVVKKLSFEKINYYALESFPNIENKPDFKEKEIKVQINKYGIDIKTRLYLLDKTKEEFDNLKMELYTYRLAMFNFSIESKSYDFNEAIKGFNDIRNSLSRQQTELSEFKDLFEEYTQKRDVVAFLNADSEYKKTAEVITKSYNDVNLKINEFQDIVSADNVEKILKTILYLKDCNVYTSFPIQFTKEQAKVSIQFVPKDATTGLQTEKISPFYFPAKTTKYWSIGSSFYYAFNLRNERFSSVASIDANNIKQINVIKENDIKNEFGIASTIRYGGKINETLGGHLSFGPGISIEQVIKPRLLLGGGISKGNKHSLAIDAGFIAGYVDSKSNSLDLTQSYSEIPQTTLTKIDYGYFISLGYLYKF